MVIFVCVSQFVESGTVVSILGVVCGVLVSSFWVFEGWFSVWVFFGV